MAVDGRLWPVMAGGGRLWPVVAGGGRGVWFSGQNHPACADVRPLVASGADAVRLSAVRAAAGESG